jgi:hypothetical protein
VRLSRPIIDTEGSRRWRPYDQEWQDWRANCQTLAQQTDKLKWLNELAKLFETAWTSNFRGSGVKQFFDVATRDVKSLSAAIRDRVERTLFDDWRNGGRSISECGRTVAALITDTSGRLLAVDDYVGKRDAGAENLRNQFAEIERGWSQFNILLGERERILDRAAFTLRERYTSLTLAEAARFSKKLLAQLVTDLTELKAGIDRAETVLGAASDQALKMVETRAPGGDAKASFVTTVGDPKEIDATRRKLVLNEDEMRTHTTIVRTRIAEALGQQPTFQALSQRLAQSDLRNIIISTSEEDVVSAHQRLITDRAERVVGVSVIDKLHDAWGDSPNASAARWRRCRVAPAASSASTKPR